MGWGSGTYLFDNILGCILGEKDLYQTMKTIIEKFEAMDWDCQMDSAYWNHPLVQQAFRELHPDWFEDDVQL